MNLRDDQGVTLVELIVYIVVSALFAALLATMFAQGLAAQTRSTERDRATGYANVISTSLAGIRNATDVSATTTVVVARIITGSGDVTYRGWGLSPDGRFRYRESDVPIALDSVEEWGFLASGLGTGSDRVDGMFDYSSTDRALIVDLVVSAGKARVDLESTIIAQALTESGGTS